LKNYSALSHEIMTIDRRQKKQILQPLISVITVVRNGERHLAKTIDSYIGQTYRNTELIIVDGNSTDRTVDVIRQYDKSITRWVSEPDRGIYDAMNKAISMCRGDYLYFLNCADRFANPHTLEEVVTCLDREWPDILCGNVLVEYEKGTQVRSYRFPTEYQLYRQTICHQALFTAKHVFALAGTFDVNYRISADREWVLRALKKYRFKISYLDLPICVFDLCGVSSRQRLRLRLENMRINHKYFKWRFYPFFLRQIAEKTIRFAFACQ
jgi:glycosyltransferase involved in cell wall biosynthesis